MKRSLKNEGVMIVHFGMCDYGGLVNDTELMSLGFREMNLPVHNVMITSSSVKYRSNRGSEKVPRSNGYELGVGTGLHIHHKNGWLGMDTFGIGGSYSDVKCAWNAILSELDVSLVVFQTPVPTLRAEYKGISSWPALYDIPQRIVSISPDANFKDSYPHFIDVIDRVDGVVCTHEASFSACSDLPLPRILLAGPHVISHEYDDVMTDDRAPGVLSVQNFKPIKRVDDFVRCIPHLKRRTKKILAGGGIEYYYMTSKEKMKPKYINKESGAPIWDEAVVAGMDYRGYLSNSQRDDIMRRVRFLVDCSWSVRYTSYGPHFNRTFIEAMNMGCIPVCTDKGMGGSRIFSPGVNYLEIPHDATPQQLAEILETFMRLPQEVTDELIANNHELKDRFDYRVVCKSIVDLSLGKRVSGLLSRKVGTGVTEELREKAATSRRFFDE